MEEHVADSTDDESAVFGVLLQVGGAFRNLDATGIEDLYVEDADWTNAFGTTLKGNQEIAEYLCDLFANTHFATGAVIGAPTASVRFLGDDVAVAKTYLERAGQQTVDGETLPVRRNHSLKVLAKEAGTWRIVSDIYMDARDESTL
jgi:uncharacterized protein (TIGR02246 family)